MSTASGITKIVIIKLFSPVFAAEHFEGLWSAEELCPSLRPACARVPPPRAPSRSQSSSWSVGPVPAEFSCRVRVWPVCRGCRSWAAGLLTSSLGLAPAHGCVDGAGKRGRSRGGTGSRSPGVLLLIGNSPLSRGSVFSRFERSDLEI